MKLPNLLQLSLFLMLLIPETILAQSMNCFSGLRISVRGSDASSAAICQDDGEANVIRFTANRLIQPVGYVVVDDNGIIVKSTFSNIIDLEGLPTGNLRVYGFYYFGKVNETEGQQLSEAALATGCYRLSENFYPIASVVPDGQSVATDDGKATVYTCPGDGVADVVSFATTSPDPFYAYVVTDENNVILDIVQGASYDFEPAPAGICRVWGVSYVGNVTASIGENIATAVFADGCYDVSDNYVEIVRSVPDGGAVSLSDGSTSRVVCANDNTPDELSFEFQTASLAPYAFVLTNADNEILQLIEGASLDFNALPVGVCRVWGLSYTGAITAAPGDNAAAIALSDDCFDLSDNFIEITKKDPDGAKVTLPGGSIEAVVCVNDGEPDVLTFVNTSSSSESYVYLVTNTGNFILDIVAGDSYDFDPTATGIARVWGVSYSGNLLVQIGDQLSTTVLSDECYERSNGFVTVARKAVEGGTVSLAGGAAEATVCVGDGAADELTFASAGAGGESFLFVVTDEDNNILDLSETGVVDFENAPAGVCRVWGLAYSGNIIANVGDNAAATVLTDECYDLSDNFVTVTRKSPDGGTVSLADGATEATVCAGDGAADELTFAVAGNEGDAFVFVITDEDNNILDLSETGVVDFENAPAGVCRVWGLAYSGNIIATVGDNAATTTLTDECFDLSDNFVTITRKSPDGGTVSLAGGATEATICVGDGAADELTFAVAGNEGDAFIFVVTDENNNILDLSETGVVDFESASPGVCRVWGLAYSGNIIATVGDNAATTVLSDECYDLSDNFVTVTRKSTEGGTVSLDNGDTEVFVCVGDGNPDLLTFVSAGAEGESFVFVVTDDNNNILSTSISGVIDFEGAEAGVCRVWGLSFTGALTAEAGANAAEAALSDECFDLSDNFVTIDRRGLNGGTVSLADGATEAVVCLDEITPDVLSFVSENASTQAEFLFVVTDTNNVILSVSAEGEIDFSGAEAGICRVWGLSYTGNLTAVPGDNAGEVQLSDQCFDLSDNFVTVDRKAVDGAVISLEDGTAEAIVCSGDEASLLLTFVNTSAAGAGYGYVFTDTNNVVISRLNGPSILLDVVPAGHYRIWGYSFTGAALLEAGDDAATATISDECFDLSDNFIAIRKDDVDGGTVSMPSGATTRFTCPDDGNPDVVQFATTGSSSGAYVYVITDENNVILGVNESGSVDFDTAGAGVSRVWGLAFSGDLLAQVGDTASAVVLSSACYDLSDNFITVVRETPNGGTVSMPSGATVRYTCPGDDTPDVVFFDSTGTSATPYGYVITDEENVILAIAQGDSFDFNDAPEGVCRVWGLAYVGELTAKVGDDADLTQLAAGCFDLSDNFIEIRREAPVGGTITFADGSRTLSLCADGGNENVVQMVAQGASAGLYAFLILQDQADGSVLISAIAESDTFDFSTLPESVYRIRGLAYTGTLQIAAGDAFNASAALTDDCYSLSSNTIRVSSILPDGGVISAEGFDSNVIELCAGDGSPDSLVFVVGTLAGAANSDVIITDVNGVFLTIVETEGFNFEGVEEDTLLVYHVSYTGLLSLGVGDQIDSVDISSDCADLSEPLILVSNRVDGGRLLSTKGNATTEFICAGDGVDDIVTLFNTSSTPEAGYLYVLTTEQGLILSTQQSNVFDVTNTRFKALQLWGVSYRGDLAPANTVIGKLIGDAVFTTGGCFVLSDNPVRLFIDEPEGGVISTASGATDLELCIGKDQSVLQLKTTSRARIGYAYVLTGENDAIIEVLDGPSIDFSDYPIGRYHIWAVSYAGTLTATPQGDFLTINLATSCFERSTNFIDVIRFPAVDGGRVLTDMGEETVYTCPGNGQADVVSFFNTGNAPNDQYLYLITDEDNRVVIPSFQQDIIDFDGARPMTYRIYGISFHGDLATQAGTNVTTAMLSDSCWELSANFITVINELPDGGTVSTADNQTEIEIIQGDGAADSVSFINTSASAQRYAYVATSESNVIIALSEDGIFDFELIGAQPTRVWGLSYAGNITAMPGDTADVAALTDDCWDLSDNFVLVNVSIMGVENARDNDRQQIVIERDRILAIPNPALDRVNLRIELHTPAQSESIVHIFNANGQLVYQGQLSHVDGLHHLELNISDWRSGIYAVRVQNGDKVTTERFVKQE